MPSLDFVRDICDTLKSQGIDYYIVAIQKSNKKRETRVDAFANIKTNESLLALAKHIELLMVNVAKAKRKISKSKINKISKKGK